VKKNDGKNIKEEVVASPFWVLTSIGQCVSVQRAFITQVLLSILQDKSTKFGQNLQEGG
jgi:hypothetical protein